MHGQNAQTNATNSIFNIDLNMDPSAQKNHCMIILILALFADTESMSRHSSSVSVQKNYNWCSCCEDWDNIFGDKQKQHLNGLPPNKNVGCYASVSRCLYIMTLPR